MRLRRRSSAPRKRRRIRKLRLLTLVLVLLALSAASFTYGVITAVASQTWKLESLRQQEREVNGYIWDRRGKKILAVLRGSENRVIVDSDAIAPIMKQAIVAVEDRRFWEHEGVDFRAIGRAFWADVRSQEFAQGGSTITQQFVKNVYVDDERSIARKLREAILARQLDQRWSKERILTEYLNTIYFGNGAYGVEQAARTYFQHSASKLALHESALLAAIPSDPSRFDPVTNPKAARRQRNVVLRLMLAQGTITAKQFRNAAKQRLPKPEGVRPPGTRGPAPYFASYVTQQLVDKYGTSVVFGGGLQVRTTIDLDLQRIAHQSIAKWLTDPKGPTAALVAIDPRRGDVLAMVGGKSFRENQFNLAVQGERQPGSSFKPFVLAAALDQGIAPQTRFDSEELDIPFDNKVWHVENYEGSYLGNTDLRTATVHSDNSVYAQLTSLIGPPAVAEMARRLGVRSDLNPYLSIGLGTEAVNPLEMARAFSAFAAGGKRYDGSAFGNRPRAIWWVGEQDGSTVKMKDPNRPIPRQVLDPDKTAVLNDILQAVVRIGTGKRAAIPGVAVAGKTGTTENHGDAWFVGYTPRLAVAVWVGYPHQLRPMLTEYDGGEVAGGTYPALIWKTFVKRALTQLKAPPASFDPPPALYSSPRYVVMRDGRLQLDNGICRNAFQVVVFSEGGPSRTANCRAGEIQLPRVVGLTVGAAERVVSDRSLEPLVVYKPAANGQRVGVVIEQRPVAGRRLVAGQRVTLVAAKSLGRVVPDLVGLQLGRALPKLARADLQARVQPAEAPARGRVVRQRPQAGVAVKPGATVRLVVRVRRR